jgi:hypothetical protein
MDPQHRVRTRGGIRRWLLIGVAAIGAVGMFAGGVIAASDAAALPSNWHVHDGKGATLGAQHKGIGFFPTILNQSVADYLLDPAECPNATDKVFLPSADTSNGPQLRAGMCQTSSVVIHLRTLPVGTEGPEGWASITAASEPGWVTYYVVTPRE